MTVRLLFRPRLLETMAARWNTPVVSITAGPGFGKSVLLEQAMAENRLSPRGVDVAVACRSSDRSPRRLLARIARSAGLEACTPTPESLLAELSRCFPLGVCLLLDDVHLVGRDGDGARTISALLALAGSTSVHVVVVGRERLCGLSGLRLSGQLVELDEHDLALSGDEIVELANLHGVDPAALESVGGWPAAAAIAATYGIAGAEDYIRESVFDHLDPVERRVLAVAASVGGCDAELLMHAIDDPAVDPEALLTGLPLVHRSLDGSHTVHDVWQRVIGTGGDDLRDRIVRIVDLLIERAEFDRAFHLCVAHGDWDRAARVLHACCRRGHVEVAPDVLAPWLAAWPAERRDDPDGLLLRGLVGRMHDPFGPETAALLERAVEGYRAAGNVPGELAAGVELVFVLRNQGRCEAIPVFLARAVELDEAGHVAAAGPAAMARALLAELEGDDREFLARLDAIPPGSLTQGWETVVEFRRTVSHLILGDERQMLEAANRCAGLAGDANDRHALALAQWFAGDPHLGLDTCDEIIAGGARSRVSAVFLGSLATMVLAHAGRLDDAEAQLDTMTRAVTGPLSPLLEGALVGVRALLAAASGDDESAERLLSSALAEHPLDGCTGWRMAARWLPLAYVLLPSAREHLDQRPLGAVHRRRIAVARAVVAARDGRALTADELDDLTPPAIATAIPLPWAMALAAQLANDGEPLGLRVAEYLIELFGDAAKAALRATAGHPSRRIGTGARKLLGEVVVAPYHPIRLQILGPLELRVGEDVARSVHWNRDRVRSLLLYLTLHSPCRREQVAEALWPHLDPEAADGSLRVTLTYLRQVLEPDRRKGEALYFIRQSGSTLALAGEPCFVVDAIEFEHIVASAEDADQRGVPSMALELYEQALALWRGPCLCDVAYEEWAQASSQRLTADYVSAATRAAELHLAGGAYASATRLARRVLDVDPWHEPGYRLLVATALAIGDSAGAARAMAECDAMLADLGLAADEETEMLRRRIDERLVCRA